MWYYYPRRQKGLSPKLQQAWRGPCTVVKRISDILYTVRLPDSKTCLTVHCDKLKEYTQNPNTVEIPVGSDKHDGTGTYPKTRTGRPIKPTQWYGIPY